MANERIKAISRSLGDTQFNIRLRSATLLLEKLEIGVIDEDAIATSNSLTTLLSGVQKEIALILENPDDLADRNKESNDLLQTLSIVRESVHMSTKILEQLYFLIETAIDEVRSFTALL